MALGHLTLPASVPHVTDLVTGALNMTYIHILWMIMWSTKHEGWHRGSTQWTLIITVIMLTVGFPGGSAVKNLPSVPVLKSPVWSLGQEYPLKKGMATHSSVLAWRIPRTEESGGLQSMALQRVGHDWSGLAQIFRRRKTLKREGGRQQPNHDTLVFLKNRTNQALAWWFSG